MFYLLTFQSKVMLKLINGPEKNRNNLMCIVFDEILCKSSNMIIWVIYINMGHVMCFKPIREEKQAEERKQVHLVAWTCTWWISALQLVHACTSLWSCQCIRIWMQYVTCWYTAGPRDGQYIQEGSRNMGIF